VAPVSTFPGTQGIHSFVDYPTGDGRRYPFWCGFCPSHSTRYAISLHCFSLCKMWGALFPSFVLCCQFIRTYARAYSHTQGQLEASHMILARCWPNQFHGSFVYAQAPTTHYPPPTLPFTQHPPPTGHAPAPPLWWLLQFARFLVSTMVAVASAECLVPGAGWCCYLCSGQAVDQVGTIKMIFLASVWHCTLSMCPSLLLSKCQLPRTQCCLPSLACWN